MFEIFKQFQRTLEMPLINCEVIILLIWSVNCVISAVFEATTFAITDTKLSVPVVTLST